MNTPNPAPDEAQQEQNTEAPVDYHGEVTHDDDTTFDDGTGYVP